MSAATVRPDAVPDDDRGHDAARRARLRACTLLLVDDEEANLDLLEAVLEGDGFTRLVRTDDARAVPALAERHAPDLVLLDLHMPHRHGLDVLADLRAATPPDDYRPVLVLTADATWEAKERALARGARDFVTKPFDATEVLLRVENLLDARLLHADERRARERAEAAEARATLLAEWSRILAATLDPTLALAHLPRLLVPRWARACAATLDAVTVGDVRDVTARSDGATILSATIETGGGAAGTIALAVAADHAGPRPDQALVDELAARAGLAAEGARHLAAAELATRERERLLAVVAHDLRNPLGAVAMYAEVLASLQPDDAAADDAMGRYARAALATIHGSTAAMQRLIEDLLDASSLRDGALRIHRAPVPAEAPFAEVERMLRPQAEARGVALRVARDDGGAAGDEDAVAVDAGRVVQLLSNLVGNAIRFTPRGGAVDVRWAVADGALHGEVADTGPGIAPDDLPHLFTAFWRGERRGRHGVGLGLWIARAIAEGHGGDLRVTSRPGEGTTFHFTLPLADAPRRRED